MIIKDNMANMCAKVTSTYMEFTLAFGPKLEFSFSFKSENFMNPAGNVMKEIKEADLNNFSAGAGEPRVSDGSQFCTSTKECNWGTIMFVCC